MFQRLSKTPKIFLSRYFSTLYLETGHFVCPHPEKVAKGGEDSLFVSDKLCAVADGVGGWAECGVDPALYSKELAQNIEKLWIKNQINYIKKPKTLIIEAAKLTKSMGSSTCCVVSLDKDNNLLKSAYIGDSGYMIFRVENNNYKLLFESPEQTKDFNFPFQIGTNGDEPSEAIEYEHKTQEGDIVVLGTDGLFDNLPFEMILNIIQEFEKNSKSLSELAEKIGKIAYSCSLNKNYDSPFAQRARKHGFYFKGGKSDDITIIVTKIRNKQ